VAACALGGLVLGLVIFAARGSTYEADALIAVSNPARPVAGQVDNVTGPAVDTAAARLGFRPNISVTVAEVAQLLTVTATDDDAERAALAANTVAESYVDAAEFGAAASIARSAPVPTSAAGLGPTMFALIGSLLGAIAGVSAEPVLRRRPTGREPQSADARDARVIDLRNAEPPDHHMALDEHQRRMAPHLEVTEASCHGVRRVGADVVTNGRTLEPVGGVGPLPRSGVGVVAVAAGVRRPGTFAAATAVGLTSTPASRLEFPDPSLVLSDRNPAETRSPTQKSSPSMNSDTSSSSEVGREPTGKEPATRRSGLFASGADRPRSRMFGSGDVAPSGPIFTLREGPVSGTRFFQTDASNEFGSDRNGTGHEPVVPSSDSHESRDSVAPRPVPEQEMPDHDSAPPAVPVPMVTPTRADQPPATPTPEAPQNPTAVAPTPATPTPEAPQNPMPTATTSQTSAPPAAPTERVIPAAPRYEVATSGPHGAPPPAPPSTAAPAEAQMLQAELDAARAELVLDHNQELARLRSEHERQSSELRTEVARLTKQLRIQASRLASRTGPDQTRVGDLEAQIDALDIELTQLRQTLESERIAHAKKLTDERGAADRALDNIRRVHREELAKHLHTHRQSLADHRNELDNELARDRAAHAAALDAEHERYEAQLDAERQRFENALAGVVQRHRSELDALREAGRADLSRQAAQYKATIAQLRVVTDAAEERVQEVERDNRMLRAALGSHQKQARHEQNDHAAAMERATEDLAIARAELEAERERNAALRADVLRRSAESHQAIDRAVEERTAQLAELEASVARQRQYADDRVREISEAAEEQARQAAVREADLTAAISRLKRELAESRDRPVEP